MEGVKFNIPASESVEALEQGTGCGWDEKNDGLSAQLVQGMGEERVQHGFVACECGADHGPVWMAGEGERSIDGPLTVLEYQNFPWESCLRKECLMITQA